MSTRKTPVARPTADPKGPSARKRASSAAAATRAKPRKQATPAAAKAGPETPTAARTAAKKESGAVGKLVRDSFTMPHADFSLIAELKARALDFKRPAKKSELLRAGLHALNRLDDAALHAALEALTPLKTGRPRKSG